MDVGSLGQLFLRPAMLQSCPADARTECPAVCRLLEGWSTRGHVMTI